MMMTDDVQMFCDGSSETTSYLGIGYKYKLAQELLGIFELGRSGRILAASDVNTLVEEVKKCALCDFSTRRFYYYTN